MFKKFMERDFLIYIFERLKGKQIKGGKRMKEKYLCVYLIVY